MVSQLVEAPSAPVTVRILYVSEEVHDSLHNPYDFDLMEFIGKDLRAPRPALPTWHTDNSKRPNHVLRARRSLRSISMSALCSPQGKTSRRVGRGADTCSLRTRTTCGRTRLCGDLPIASWACAMTWCMPPFEGV
jgi:hypothetical protein